MRVNRVLCGTIRSRSDLQHHAKSQHALCTTGPAASVATVVTSASRRAPGAPASSGADVRYIHVYIPTCATCASPPGAQQSVTKIGQAIRRASRGWIDGWPTRKMATWRSRALLSNASNRRVPHVAHERKTAVKPRKWAWRVWQVSRRTSDLLIYDEEPSCHAAG